MALLHAIAAIAAKLTRIPVRTVLLVGFGLLFALSFARSVLLTDINQAYAYFDTSARLWEFAAGSLFALASPWLRLPDRVRGVASWVGLLAIVTCGFLLPVESRFPGVAALWPVIAAGLVIVSAGPPTTFGADRLLRRPVLERAGGYTYSLYLVHWPALVIMTEALPRDVPDGVRTTLVAVTSVVAAIAVTRLIERPAAKLVVRAAGDDRPASPVRAWWARSKRPAIAIVACFAIGAATVGAGVVLRDRLLAADRAAFENVDLSSLGANADPYLSLEAGTIPSLADAKTDWVWAGENCADDDPYRVRTCQLALSQSGSPTRQLLVVGNSHSGQLAGAVVQTMAVEPDWEARIQITAACAISVPAPEPGTVCDDQWRLTEQYIADVRPDAVVLLGTTSAVDGEVVQAGLPAWITAMSSVSPDTAFIVMRDNPRFERSMLTCLIDGEVTVEACASPAPDTDLGGFAGEIEATGAHWVDLTASICLDGTCPAVRGGVITYLDRDHVTYTYARTMAQPLADVLAPRIDWWPSRAFA